MSTVTRKSPTRFSLAVQTAHLHAPLDGASTSEEEDTGRSTDSPPSGKSPCHKLQESPQKQARELGAYESETPWHCFSSGQSPFPSSISPILECCSACSSSLEETCCFEDPGWAPETETEDDDPAAPCSCSRDPQSMAFYADQSSGEASLAQRAIRGVLLNAPREELINLLRGVECTISDDKDCRVSLRAPYSRNGYTQLNLPMALVHRYNPDLDLTSVRTVKVTCHSVAAVVAHGPPPELTGVWEVHHRCHSPACFSWESGDNAHVVWLRPEEHARIRCPRNVHVDCPRCHTRMNLCRELQRAGRGHPGPHCF